MYKLRPVKEMFNAALRMRVLFAFLLACVASQASASDFHVVAFGDSLMAGFGLKQSQAFPSQLQKHLQESGWNVEVTNLSVSGNTTADGLNRIEQVVGSEPDLVLVGLGSNDALRNIDPGQAYANLNKIIIRLREADLDTLLLGAMSPLNWGLKYKSEFDGIFPLLAKEHDLPLYPFILEGVALDPVYVLPDGLHPNPAGVEVMVKKIAPHVENILSAKSNWELKNASN